MSNGTVLISGAGIAGLALAHWLRRHGFTPTVVERAPALRSGGQAVDIRGAARDVVTRMGLMDSIRAHHTGTHGIAYLDGHGRRVATLGGDLFGDSGGIVAEIEILRGDLVRILYEAAGDVEYLFGDVITGLTEDGDGVTATFRDAPARSFDLVVGADGLRSGVRALAFGPEPAYVRDLGYYNAFFAARTRLRLDGWELLYNLPAGNGVGGRAVLLYPIGDGGEVRVLLAFSAPELSLDRADVDGQKDLLARAYADAGWELPGLLEQLRHTDDLYVDRAGEVRVDRWSQGRAVLLGDAAFGGSLGMGTSMALVGAYVLAGELAAAGGDHARAFAAYESGLRGYVGANQKRPPGGINGLAPRTRRGIWVRNQFTRLLPHLPGKGALMGGIQKSANAVTLADYGLPG
ncbi:FAD-dependent monooxygenase [Planosporangium sp. 12N6]|uniref:FAD-dependent monooxygenase n=1 Tax=Planosporangium spinosum TaxID=3402278 RepID=UPI003CEA2BEE